MNNIWQLQDAKSKFSELVNQALTRGTQIITRHGKNTVVVMSFTDYEKLTQQKGSLSKYLLSSPLKDSELPIERKKDLPRSMDIEP